jgi:hypothetical protein
MRRIVVAVSGTFSYFMVGRVERAPWQTPHTHMLEEKQPHRRCGAGTFDA